MSATRPTIPVRYLVEVLERAKPSAQVITRALEAAAVPRTVLRSARMRFSIEQFERIHAVLTSALDDELFGFFEKAVPAGAYATLVRLLAGCADVASALDAASRFYRLFDRHRYWQWTFEGKSARLELVAREAAQRRSIFFVHSMLLAPWRTMSWLAAQPIVLDAVELPSPFRNFRAETEYLFACAPRFVRGNAAITLKREQLERPIARTASEAGAWAKTSFREMLLAPKDETVHSRLRAILSTARPVADVSIGEAAKRLHVSRATLARKLAERGVSFQRVKDELRRDHAIGLLTTTALPIADIAERLGYSAPSAFQRAFREWTGVPPGAMRSDYRP